MTSRALRRLGEFELEMTGVRPSDDAPEEQTAGRRTQAQRREEAASKLINAAIDLIARKGYDGFTLAEVGETAGYSRGLPTHYFGDKERLLSSVAEHLVQSYHAALADQPQAERGLPRLNQMVRQYAATRASPGMRALGILIAHASVLPVLSAAVKELNAQGLQMLEDEINLGIELGNLRPDTDRERVARMIYAFLRGQLAFSVLDAGFDGPSVAEEFIAALAAHLDPAASAGSPCSSSN